MQKIEAIFDGLGAVIKTKESKNGKYTSVSIDVVMENPEAVIEKYKEVASKIEGVISFNNCTCLIRENENLIYCLLNLCKKREFETLFFILKQPFVYFAS